MKVAFCLTGLVDNEKSTIAGLEELSISQDMDFFCHTWDDDKNPGKDIINNFDFVNTATSTYKEFEDHILENNIAKVLYNESRSKKEIRHFFRTHMAQFYSTIKCVDMALSHDSSYDLIIKARSNLRFEKTLCGQLPKNLESQTLPILNREPSAWRHFQQPNSDDRPDTQWDRWPECIKDIQVVFVTATHYPVWRNYNAFMDTMFAMEKSFAYDHILHKDFLEKILQKFLYFARHSDTLAMEADKVWHKYLMDNNVAIFGFPIDSWMHRDKKIII